MRCRGAAFKQGALQGRAVLRLRACSQLFPQRADGDLHPGWTEPRASLGSSSALLPHLLLFKYICIIIVIFILSPNLLNFSETKRLSSLLCAWVGAACVGCGISGIRRFWKSWRNPICLRCGGVLLCLFCLLFFNHPEENGQVWIKIKL